MRRRARVRSKGLAGPRRSLCKSTFSPRFESLEPRLVLDSTLVFNEVMYQPANDDVSLEWVEFYNQMAANLDISGWSLRGGVDFDFPAGTVVPGRSYLVVAANPAALAAAGGPANARGPFIGQLDNDGEELRLLNNNGREMNVLDYRDRGDWPVGADGSGASLAKLDLLGASELAENWTSSLQRQGTPGGENFPAPRVAGLVLNEIESAQAEEFFVEIANLGGVAVNLQGVSLSSSDPAGGSYVFPSQMLAAGEVALVGETELGFRGQDGDRLFLWDGQQQLVDAHRVTDRLRGRAEGADEEWIYPSAATPGQANEFQLHDEIVINEIMYHYRPDPPQGASPGTFQTEILFPMNGIWRYNQSGANLGANWAATTHPVNGSTWISGQGLLGFETTALSEPIRTTLTNPANNNPRVTTYYFETEFQFDGDPQEPGLELMIRQFIDDGAVFYLNGQLIAAYNMPATFNSSTFAVAGIGNAPSLGPTAVVQDALVAGANRLSVEVHQVGATSSDVVMGVELLARRQDQPADPGDPYLESDEEWVELYNRGNTPVDLSGWELAGAVQYQINPGTVIAPDGYLVVARDAAALRAKYPGITVVGDFDGSLNDKTDRLVLRDARKNPADSVQYYDGGYWPEYADGGGSTLELKNPFADNSKAEAWAASDEASKAQWQQYSFRQTAHPDTGPIIWNEFVMGLLDRGEVLIDNVSVISNPDTAPSQWIQNGSFQADALGQPPSRWRIIGNHQGTVVADPDSPSNRVLHLAATGVTEHQHNHAETTFVGDRPVVDGVEFLVSFRARWVAGSPQLNSRFYVNRVQETTILDVPELNGTPGARNSTYQANVGPTFAGLIHSPPLPNAGQTVTVSARAEDPDKVTSMTLFYAVNDGVWRSAAMTDLGEGDFRGAIPGQSGGATVQFYVEGRDGAGAAATFPAQGRDSRALVKFNDNLTTNRPVDTLRIVMTNAEASDMYVDTNIMSNQFVGATVIYNNQQVFYDVGVRLKGSPFGRSDFDLQDSYNLRFRPEQPFRGVHERIALDGSGRTPWFRDSRDEILIKHLMNHAGGMTSMYDDIAYMAAPLVGNSGPVLLQMARYGNDYLDERFENGGDGTLYEFEVINFSFSTTNGDPESLKLASAASLLGTDIRDLGDSKEDYRWNFMIKNNRARDDYGRIIELAKAFDLGGAALDQATRELMDVDQWMRAFAMFSLSGNIDVYTKALDHNIFLYERPEDQKILVLPWDMDFSFTDDIDAPLYGTGNLQKIIEIPTNLRLFHGHLLDMTRTTFNLTYANTWANYYSTLSGENYSSHAFYIRDRANFVRSQLPPQIPLTITTNGGRNFTTSSDFVTLQGNGWIDVREIYLAGGDQPLDVAWLDGDSWQVVLPLTAGANTFILQARNMQGDQVGLDSITVTSTATTPPLTEALRISELNYNPHDPLDGSYNNDDFEFVELTNVSAAPINLQGARFVDGIQFTFSDRVLNPGEFVLAVKNQAAFESRYGTDLAVAGVFAGSLDNGGESISLIDGLGAAIAAFAYDDSGAWPGRADGNASSLQIVDTAGDYSDPNNWRSSIEYGGSPGAAGMLPFSDVVVNEVLTHTDPPQTDSIELYNASDAGVNIGGWYLSDSNSNYFKFQIPAGVMLPAGAYLVFDETDFNAGAGANPNDFALNGAHGDDVWLLAADANGNPTRFADRVESGAQRNGQSWGRWPNGAGDLYPMSSTTLGSSNSGPYAGEVVISEVMYNSPDPDGVGGVDPNDLEYLELYNPGPLPVDLTNWQLAGGVEYPFPSGTMLTAGQALVVVSFDLSDAARLAQFRSNYGLVDNVLLLGGFGQVLDNGSDRIQLLRPDAPPLDEPSFIPLLLEDEVNYSDQAPWPPEADGLGASLHRAAAADWGNDPASWQALDATPGVYGDGGPPPTVVSVEINAGLVDPPDLQRPQPTDWRRQRSLIGSIVITFSADIALTEEDLVLTNLGINAPAEIDQAFTLNAGHVSIAGNVATIAFDGFELQAGVYQLEILPTATSSTGIALDGDGDGLAGGVYAITGDELNRFYMIPSDYNGDLGVSIFDFPTFSYWFGLPLGVAPLYGDLNRDGGVSIFDFPVFAGNFGVGVVFDTPASLALLAPNADLPGAAAPAAPSHDDPRLEAIAEPSRGLPPVEFAAPRRDDFASRRVLQQVAAEDQLEAMRWPDLEQTLDELAAWRLAIND